MGDGQKRSGTAAGFDSVTGKVRRFFTDTVAEMHRCTWPNRHQLLESTVLVVVCTLILGCFVAGVDYVAGIVIKLITVGKL